MPTTLERTTLTLTPPIKEMLTAAARQWPEATGSRDLMIRLMAAGAAALQERELEAAYADAYRDWSASDDALAWDVVVGDGLEVTE